MSYLITTDDNGTEVKIPLDGPVEIGRNRDDFKIVVRTGNEIISLGIDDATVSRAHARICLESNRLKLQDLGSLNGTLLNDKSLPGWSAKRPSAVVDIAAESKVQFGCNTVVKIVPAMPISPISSTMPVQELTRFGKPVSINDAAPKSASVKNPPPVQRSAERPAFIRIIVEIMDECCDTDVRAKDVSKKFGVLKKYLNDKDLLDEASSVERKINAELAPEECLDQQHVEELRDFCVQFIESWIAKGQR